MERLGEMKAIKQSDEAFQKDRKRIEDEETLRKVKEYEREEEEKQRLKREVKAAEKEYLLRELQKKAENEKKKKRDLLDEREFNLNRRKLAEMGIRSVEEQQHIVGGD